MSTVLTVSDHIGGNWSVWAAGLQHRRPQMCQRVNPYSHSMPCSVLSEDREHVALFKEMEATRTGLTGTHATTLSNTSSFLNNRHLALQTVDQGGWANIASSFTIEVVVADEWRQGNGNLNHDRRLREDVFNYDCPQRHPEDTASTVAHPYNHRKTLQPVAITVSAHPPHMRN
ncbi:hypothetical protein BJV77DRAFT_962162 [Russula vinacea]|nr:hypothetical protein BJV77DRAFT_962162 [Russula vinacea]